MNRQPLIQPQAAYHNTPATTCHWMDENVDRRIVSPCGDFAAVFLCKKGAKKPKAFRPRMVRLSDNETVIDTTISNGRFFITAASWKNTDVLPLRIRDIPVTTDDDIAQRMFAAYEAAKR